MYTALLVLFISVGVDCKKPSDEHLPTIQIFDLTHPVTWKGLSEYYTAMERRWKICFNCGFPEMGTSMHLEFSGELHGMQPAVIPTEYLLTRLTIIDVTYLTKINPTLSLSLAVALQWIAVKQDPVEPTLLVFKFGWEEQPQHYKVNQCVCQMPGLSYELAQWIAANLSHVVGIATDAPSLETDETREHYSRTVVNLLANSGIYMIENVNLKRDIPESGCLALAMPLKMLATSYVPARLAAFCPPHNNGERVVLTHQQSSPRHLQSGRVPQSRQFEVSLEEILSH